MPTASTFNAIAALINSGKLGDYVLYEQGETLFLAGRPVWEVTITAAEKDPWAAIERAVSSGKIAGKPIYGWLAFELAAREGIQNTNEVLAQLFVPGIELRFTGEEVQISSDDSTLVEELRGIIDGAVSYQPGTPQGINVAEIDEHYKQSVAAAVKEIEEGKLQKVILSRVVDIPFQINILDTYLRGRAANTPARSFLLGIGDFQAAGFSPETVAEITADGHATTQPLAGTRARTGDPAANEALRTELMSDPKEIFEHAASVKLACEELDSVASDDGAWVSEFMVIKPRGSVQHLGSRVDCHLAHDKTAWDALRVLFPAITASGIPKAPAFDLISRHEKTPRSLYSGAVIRCSGDGAIDAALVLRTVYQKAGKAWLRAGAGIVQGSRPEREHEETREKLSSVAPHVVAG